MCVVHRVIESGVERDKPEPYFETEPPCIAFPFCDLTPRHEPFENEPCRQPTQAQGSAVCHCSGKMADKVSDLPHQIKPTNGSPTQHMEVESLLLVEHGNTFKNIQQVKSGWHKAAQVWWRLSFSFLNPHRPCRSRSCSTATQSGAHHYQSIVVKQEHITS